ncbi:hypothetical protein BpHYR1_009748 [Brachionus plicatilis]|uniref:Uncharacterized protein n=1 Tax=Brachionus plicatilis TaxID=10195 RepID=A0A3M7SC86_BRAPC|nr:hypothetical protein BpHYR1_009748 [Brachionus plicatilis]
MRHKFLLHQHFLLIGFKAIDLDLVWSKPKTTLSGTTNEPPTKCWQNKKKSQNQKILKKIFIQEKFFFLKNLRQESLRRQSARRSPFVFNTQKPDFVYTSKDQRCQIDTFNKNMHNTRQILVY